MKKLLSILTISTLTTSVPAPLLANTVQNRTRVKRDVGSLTSNSNNDYLSLKQINGIKNQFSLAVDSKDNIYFVLSDKLFVLKHGETTPTKINGIKDNIKSLAVDSNDNLFIATNKGLYNLVYGATTPTKIDGINDFIYSLAVDNSNNIYYIKSNMEGTFVLKQGATTPTKIDGIDKSVKSLAVDSNDNIYFGTDKGVYKLDVGATTPIKIDGISGEIRTIKTDSKNNIFYVISGSDGFAFVLKHGETTPTKIDGISSVLSLAIDSKDNIYFSSVFYNFSILQTALSWTKQQSQFALVDSTKTKTWTRPDLLSVDGELNIDIANPNIDKVIFDNVQQGQTNKHWTINVKPEIAPRDHNLQVMFTLDGKQYTSEITVSMQAKIDPPTPAVQQNLSELIKTTDLGNIIDNNDNTIFTAVNQKNSNVIDDFSQIEITKKDNHSATLSAIEGSKSYAGSVNVTYNVVPTTVVDLKIDVTSTSSTATVIKDYLGQIDTSNITNPVNTFYYANSESVITMVKPTPSSVITGVVYGCDEQWNKTSQSSNIDPTSGIKLDGSQLNTNDGKYVVALSDNLGHTNNVYLQIAKDKKIANYFDTDNGKQFEMWAKANGYDNIRGSSASQLNKLFDESKNWQQIASDSQFASAVADWFKTNGKLVSKEPLTKEQVIEQLKTQIPSDIKIAGVNTSNYDVNKVSFELNQSEFKPNDKVNITVKYNNASTEQFTLQIKDSKTPDNNKKDGDSKLWIIGVVVGVLAGLGLAYWLFKRFVFDKYFLPKIKRRRHLKLVEQVRKEEAEKEAAKQKEGDE
jgi:hypothetical protein